MTMPQIVLNYSQCRITIKGGQWQLLWWTDHLRRPNALGRRLLFEEVTHSKLRKT
jgi:hypothetical protein